jgi:Mrp family chromosome partitioning ATPase/capsular polysaccharide biosynthesis protein
VEPGHADSLGALRHRWWMVGLGVLLGLATAAGWLRTQAPVWESATSVLVHPVGQDTNVSGGRTQGEVNLDTEAQLVRSTAVAAGAAELLGTGEPPESLAGRVEVEVPPNTSVLAITFAAGTPEAAQAGAQAFAAAYLDHRGRAARAELEAQARAIDERIEQLERALNRLNQRVSGTLPGTAAAADLESQRTAVTEQLTSLTDRVNQLTTATLNPGAVIQEAGLPARPSWPQPALGLASGAALGLVAGGVAAALADRLARRVSRPADLSRRLGVPVLAALTGAGAPPPDEIASPYAPAGRGFDRLRNELLAGLADRPARPDRPGRVIVVTSASSCAATGLVATNLAASLSRSGHEVALVAAGLRPEPGDPGPLRRLLGIAATPGLSEVLTGRAEIEEALQRTARFPRLRAMTMGGTATAAGLMQSPAFRTVLTALAGLTGYVVVAAPATSGSADAQSLAGQADLALLVVEPRRTRIADVRDAVTQLHRVDTPLLGAVLVPRRNPPARLPWTHRFPWTRRSAPPVSPVSPASPGSPVPAQPAEPAEESHTLTLPKLADEPADATH